MSGLAVMAVDPGGKTGVTWGWFNAEADGVGSAMRRARRRGSFFAVELAGTPQAQAWWIARQWVEFHYHSINELGCRSEDVSLAIEAFELRQRHVELAPVQVTFGLLTLLESGRLTQREAVDKKTDDIVVFEKTNMYQNGKKTDGKFAKLQTATRGYPISQPRFQKASAAKSFATNNRLRSWDAWTRGSEHARDATRHLALRLSEMLG